jgi:poly(A) polymerase
MTDRITGDWIRDPAAQAVCSMLTDAGYDAHFVGGCVRNALIGAPISDLDISTNARPETVTDLAQNAGFHAVPTGIEHGTVTVVVDGAPFEVTTWRRDVETDGRRATVVYADTMEEDALRRDFTMNALYAAPDGEIVDPLGGMEDLRARCVRFIDDAEDRIREDYLRILRFFRFHAWYGDPEGGLDQEALAAIAALSAGLETLSRERIGAEMIKLLSAPDPAPAVATMEHTGVLHHVIPGLSPAALPRLVHLEEEYGVAPDALRRLAVLGGDDHKDALRLSKADAKRLAALRAGIGSLDAPAALGYRHGPEVAEDIVLLRAALTEMPPRDGYRADIERGARATFPVKPGDLMPDYEGPALGDKLKTLEAAWIASDFAASRETLLGMA